MLNVLINTHVNMRGDRLHFRRILSTWMIFSGRTRLWAFQFNNGVITPNRRC